MSDTATEPVARYSYKWRVVCEPKPLKLDYVFAADEKEATEKAYRLLDLLPDDPITVFRVSDMTGLVWRLN